jgi:hypothetical protein
MMGRGSIDCVIGQRGRRKMIAPYHDSVKVELRLFSMFIVRLILRRSKVHTHLPVRYLHEIGTQLYLPRPRISVQSD